MEKLDGEFDMDVPILLWVLCIALPLITGMIMSLVIWASYQRGLDEYRLERKDISEIIKKKRRYVKMFIFISIVPAFYGIVPIVLLMNSGEVVEHYQERAVDMVGWVLGIPAMISVISQGVLVSYFMKDFLKEEEPDFKEIYKQGCSRSSPYNRERYPFSSNVVICTIPQTMATYGLIIAFFLLTFSSMLDGESADGDLNQTGNAEGYGDVGLLINEENIDEVMTGSWIFVGLSTLSFFSAILPMFVKGSIMEKRVFKWRIILCTVGTLPSIIGLMIWIFMIV